jgi:uncharacterized membrane protein
MDSFTRLLQAQPLVFFHLVTAFSALVVGIVIMRRRKGTAGHRVLGWTWVALMGATALASAFIRNPDGVNLAGFTPIHVFTAVVAVMLPRGIWNIRRGNVAAHRKAMGGLFLGACVVAGVFTLLPGRFLGQLLWQQWLGLV